MKFRRQKGQSVSGEYAVALILVVAAVSMMGVYIRRALQARTHDANVYMINSARAAGNHVNILVEYEPYYAYTQTDTEQSMNDVVRVKADGAYEQRIATSRSSQGESAQLPPCHYTGECQLDSDFTQAPLPYFKELDDVHNNPDSVEWNVGVNPVDPFAPSEYDESTGERIEIEPSEDWAAADADTVWSKK